MPIPNIIAVIFDFDDTLTDDPMSMFLAKHKNKGVDPRSFWQERNDLVKQGWDPTLGYLHLLLKYVDRGKIPPLTSKILKDFGRTLKPYPGLRKLFKELRYIGSQYRCDVEFYIVSGGIQEMIEGFPLRSEFKAVWGCQLGSEKPGGELRYIKSTVSFTEKTRYLFVINKGLGPKQLASNPYLVNEEISNRRNAGYPSVI